jgi:WXG100 family type VII secretion target
MIGPNSGEENASVSDKVGGVLPHMDQMGRQFNTQAQAIREVQRALQGEADKIPASWSGPNANRFKEAWEAFKPSFNKMATELEEAQAGIKRNRDAIAAATGSG